MRSVRVSDTGPLLKQICLLNMTIFGFWSQNLRLYWLSWCGIRVFTCRYTSDFLHFYLLVFLFKYLEMAPCLHASWAASWAVYEEGGHSGEDWVLLCDCIVLHGSMWYWSVLVRQGFIPLGSSAGKCVFGIVTTRMWAVEPSSEAWTELVVKVEIICHSWDWHKAVKQRELRRCPSTAKGRMVTAWQVAVCLVRQTREQEWLEEERRWARLRLVEGVCQGWSCKRWGCESRRETGWLHSH